MSEVFKLSRRNASAKWQVRKRCASGRAAAETDLAERRERNLSRTTGHAELADGGRIATECGSRNHDVNLHPNGSLNRVAKVNLREPCSDDEHGP